VNLAPHKNELKYINNHNIQVMLIPVRCFTCGKVLGNKENLYKQLLENNVPIDQIYKALGIKRACCKRILLTNVNVADKMAAYTSLPEKVHDADNTEAIRQYKAV